MQNILNDKFGLSYLSGNAQYLYANTSTNQQFDTVTANNFFSSGNLTFTINTGGLYATSVYAPSGNISAANIVIGGNLYLTSAGAGEVGQFLVQTLEGVRWTTSSFYGGEINGWFTVANTTASTSTTQGVFKVHGGSAFWGNIYANGNIVATGANSHISNVQIGQGWDFNSFQSRANLVTANIANLHVTSANITTLSAPNFSSSNGSITGSSSGIGAFKTSSTSNNWTVSAVGNLYASQGFITNFGTSNASITGTSTGVGAIRSSASSNNWSVSAIGNLYTTYGFITNFSTANASITSSVSGVGARKAGASSNNWTVDPIGNLYALNGMVNNFSSGNIFIRAGTASQAPLTLTAGTNLTAAAAGAIEYDGSVFYATPSTSLGRSFVATPIFTSGVGTSGTTGVTDYALFPAGNDTITLPVGTYNVKLIIRADVSGSTSTSSLNLNMRGTGTAVGTFSGFSQSTTSTNGIYYSYPFAATALGTSVVLTQLNDFNPRNYLAIVNGTLRITTAGTIIPSYQFITTLVSGTVTLYADNYLIITPMSNSGTTTAVGAWS